MPEQLYIPQKPLAHYVAHFYYSAGYTPPPRKERVLPSGSAQLIINLGNTFFRHFKKKNADAIKSDAAIIAGVNSRYIFLDPQTRLSTIGAVFKPGGIQALLDYSAADFLDRTASLTDVIGGDIAALRQCLMAKSTPQQKFRLLESFLMQQADPLYQPNAGIQRAVQLLQDHPERSISAIAETIGYSRRQLSTLFRHAAGIAPKEYARIQRFQKAIKSIRSCSSPKWSQLALSCGYYDQSHFNRDFKRLSDLTPSQYLRTYTDEANHLPA